MDFYIIIILLLICCIIGILIYNKIDKNRAEKIKNKRKRLKVLYEKEKDLTKKIQSYNELEVSLRKKSDNLLLKIKEYNSTLDQLAHDGRVAMAKQLAEEEAARRNFLNKKLEDEEKKANESFANYRDELLKTLEPLKKEISEYQAKKEATIQALKREQELQNNLKFHQIQLKESDIEDIKYLKTILNKLSNKTAIAKVIYDVYISQPTKELLTRIVGNDRKSGIYRITNIINQECYVGQSTDLKARITQHIRGSLGIQTIADQRVHHAMSDIGLENWTFEILEFCEKADLNNREKYWINYYKSNEYGYNNTRGNN